MLADSLTSVLVSLVLDKWFNQTLCVSYFTELVLGSFGDGPVNKCRHYMLAILIGLLRDFL